MIRKILLVLMTVILISASDRQPQRGYRGFVDWASSVHSTKPVGEFNPDTETGFSLVFRQVTDISSTRDGFSGPDIRGKSAGN